MREQTPGAPHAALNLVEYQQGARAVAQIAQTFQTNVGHCTNTPLALNGFDQNGSGAFGNRCAKGIMIAPFQLRKTGHQGAEPLGHLFRTGSRDCPGGPTMECAVKSDDLHPVGLPFVGPVFARHLDGEFAGFSA